jgi:AcrR family transcriptional regulator
LLSEGRSAASIQEITDLADVGFGSFYNHFASKEELFEAAVQAALETHGALLRQLTEGLTDPAEIFAASFRLTGRLQRRMPALVDVVLHVGTSILVTDRGLRPLVLADIAAAVAQGRFSVPDPELGLATVGGALLGLLELLRSRPELDDESASDAVALSVLRMLGLSAEDALEVCSRPLPAIPGPDLASTANS